MGFKSPQTLFGSSGPRGAQWKPEASKMRTISGALWAPKRLLQFGSGKQMLVKLILPEISGDDAAQKWMWWQRLGFFKPKRLMQFGKFINTGEIGYNLCLAALYCRRRGCLPGKTTTDSTLFLCTILDKDFCKHQFGVSKSAHQARLDLRPPKRNPSKLCPILLRSCSLV